MRPLDEYIILGCTKKFLMGTGWKAMFSIKETLASMLEYWDRVM